MFVKNLNLWETLCELYNVETVGKAKMSHTAPFLLQPEKNKTKNKHQTSKE